jgi:hypothetical protein
LCRLLLEQGGHVEAEMGCCACRRDLCGRRFGDASSGSGVASHLLLLKLVLFDVTIEIGLLSEAAEKEMNLIEKFCLPIAFRTLERLFLVVDVADVAL